MFCWLYDAELIVWERGGSGSNVKLSGLRCCLDPGQAGAHFRVLISSSKNWEDV